MLRKEFIALIKIRDHARKAVRYCESLQSFDEFDSSPMVAEAAFFNLLQIGELSHDILSEETKALLPGIPWDSVYGLRNRIVHGYADIDNVIIFSTIKNDLPVLIGEVERIVGSNESEDFEAEPDRNSDPVNGAANRAAIREMLGESAEEQDG